MTGWLEFLAAALVSGVVARAVARVAIAKAPPSLMRTNVDGDEVPAVLGCAVAAGVGAAAVSMAAWIALDHRPPPCPPGDICIEPLMLVPWEVAWLPLIPVLGMFAAGTWDDLRGDERPRGFAGHLAAARGGAITGGFVKLVAGGVVSLVTIAAVAGWEVPAVGDWLLLAAPVALGANLVNLLDRAPGRALKVFLVAALPLVVFVPAFRPLAAGSLGAAVALLPVDLKAKGMLGDAGANPLGAVLGLGLVLTVAVATREAGAVGGSRSIVTIVVVVLLGANLASERWSFSRAIEATPWLARLDRLGRK
ncbi:MAG TPA: hypothetical protein VG929_07250 [Actinomycetota bacterium]|nr:hypothetical protein [Actinomycetota bacterium]